MKGYLAIISALHFSLLYETKFKAIELAVVETQNCLSTLVILAKYIWSVKQKWKMKEILTNLGCLWGGRGPVLQPDPLRNSAGTAISAILTILGCLRGEIEVLLLLDTS